MSRRSSRHNRKWSVMVMSLYGRLLLQTAALDDFEEVKALCAQARALDFKAKIYFARPYGNLEQWA